MIRSLFHGVMNIAQLAVVGVVGASLEERAVGAGEAIRSAAPVLVLGAILIALVCAVLEVRECPRGRRGR